MISLYMYCYCKNEAYKCNEAVCISETSLKWHLRLCHISQVRWSTCGKQMNFTELSVVKSSWDIHCVVAFSALVSVSEEVRSRCHLKHRTSQYMMKESPSSDSLNTDMTTGTYSSDSLNTDMTKGTYSSDSLNTDMTTGTYSSDSLNTDMTTGGCINLHLTCQGFPKA
jgi:hypothetical protein